MADTDAARPPDLVRRQFVAECPNQLWLADITYASTWEGWLYVSFILDCYSRMIVGWQIASHMRTDLVLDALEMAIFRRDVTGRLIHHSDYAEDRVKPRNRGRGRCRQGLLTGSSA
jgi:transposase InsO family protein